MRDSDTSVTLWFESNQLVPLRYGECDQRLCGVRHPVPGLHQQHGSDRSQHRRRAFYQVTRKKTNNNNKHLALFTLSYNRFLFYLADQVTRCQSPSGSNVLAELTAAPRCLIFTCLGTFALLNVMLLFCYDVIILLLLLLLQ